MGRRPKITIKGLTVFLVECADGSYYSGICEDMIRQLKEINEWRMGFYFNKHPERVPVKIIFREDNIPFPEAYAKHRYLRYMSRRHREKLVRTKTWPLGKILKEFLREQTLKDKKGETT